MSTLHYFGTAKHEAANPIEIRKYIVEPEKYVRIVCNASGQTLSQLRHLIEIPEMPESPNHINSSECNRAVMNSVVSGVRLETGANGRIPYSDCILQLHQRHSVTEHAPRNAIYLVLERQCPSVIDRPASQRRESLLPGPPTIIHRSCRHHCLSVCQVC